METKTSQNRTNSKFYEVTKDVEEDCKGSYRMNCDRNENETENNLCSGTSSITSCKIDSKLPYPKQVFLIVGNEFCERFNFFGMRAILVLYISTKLHVSERVATLQFHTFTFMVYVTCLIGSIISDVWLGKYRTILYLSIVYAIGSVVVAVGTIPLFDMHRAASLYVGLALIGVGSGGIKPCVSAFGGDQFQLPAQAVQMTKFFSIFYFTINAGALLSTAITPNIREKLHCFGENDCYCLAFGVPALLMIVAVFCFTSGKSSYIIKISSENMIIRVSKCIGYGIKKKIQGANPIQKHFLDYSVEKYGQNLVDDTKMLLHILMLYLPLPVFWSLFEQQGSRWTFQAERMNPDIGFYVIPSEQMQFFNAFLILTFIPLFDCYVYPLLSKIGIQRPLQKITLGGFLAAFAFLLTATVEWYIATSPPRSVCIFWQLPQYVVMTAAEVMFSITGLAFSYEQAPENMKSVVQALWILMVAFGNAIIICIEGVSIFKSSIYDILLFSVIMTLDMFVFMFIAKRFKPKQAN